MYLEGDASLSWFPLTFHVLESKKIRGLFIGTMAYVIGWEQRDSDD